MPRPVPRPIQENERGRGGPSTTAATAAGQAPRRGRRVRHLRPLRQPPDVGTGADHTLVAQLVNAPPMRLVSESTYSVARYTRPLTTFVAE